MLHPSCVCSSLVQGKQTPPLKAMKNVVLQNLEEKTSYLKKKIKRLDDVGGLNKLHIDSSTRKLFHEAHEFFYCCEFFITHFLCSFLCLPLRDYLYYLQLV